jgi:hypothetical protein
MMKDAFGWMLGIQKRSIDDLKVDELDAKVRATLRLKESWERELGKADKEYRDAVSVEANAARSPIARRLSLQRGAIVAKKVRTLTSAVNMLSKMGGVVDQLKLLKGFHADMVETMKLPRGMSVEAVIKQVYAMGDQMAVKKDELDKMMGALDSVNDAVRETTGDDEIEKLMADLNALYDEYNTKLAMNDAKAADEVRAKIELKKAEMDRQMGVAVPA